MNAQYSNTTENYINLNKYALKHRIVLFGADSFYHFPVGEIIQTYNMDVVVYNRSFCGLTATDAEELYFLSVVPLRPQKLFLNLGETEWNQGKEFSEICEVYKKFLATVKRTLPQCEIFLVGMCGSDKKTALFNKNLSALTEKTAKYIDISSCRKVGAPSFSPDTYISTMRTLKQWFRSRTPSFDEIWETVNVWN